MASKSSQPALYEKMRSRSVPTAPPASDSSPPPASFTEDTGWLSPGRTLRLPVGYILLTCGIALVLLVAVYMMGVRRGQSLERSGVDQRIINDASAGITDPLTTLDPVMDTRGGQGTVGRPAANTSGRNVSSGTWGPIMSPRDPRQKGLNYFILAETNEQGAVMLAEFCRSQGLETYVVSGKNDRLRRVVAFPGFEAAARTSQPIKALEAQIHSIGDKWKKNKGATDLRDAYPSLYGG